MKNISLLLVLVAAACVTAGELTVSWEAPTSNPEVRECSLGQYFFIPGSDNTGSPGSPALPVFPEKVLMPPGAVVDEVTVENSSTTDLSGTYDLKPVQHGVPLCMQDMYHPTPRDAAAYSHVAMNPLVEAVSQGSLMGCNILDLRVSPITWDPSTGRAEMTTSAIFHISYHYGTPMPAPAGRGSEGNRLVSRLVRSQVLNPQDFHSGPEIDSKDLPWGEYLIVTRDSMVQYFEPLAQFKTMKGVPAAIVTMEYIDANYTGVDEAQKLRFFLRDIYDGDPPTYVLLGGDTPLVPHRNCWATAEGYTGDPAADIYFQDMNDPAVGTDYWDANGNGTWGEISGDIMDYHPDYFIGRASVENGVEANTFVTKVLTYEMPEIADLKDTDPWYTSMGFTTGVLWTNPYCPGSAGKEKVDTLYTPAAWQPVVKHYQSAGTQSYSLTMDMLNAGMQLVNHAGHGSEGSVSIGTSSLGTGDFAELTNISANGRVSIWNSIACLSGSFDTGNCLAEAWINSPGGGGFCMMNTRYGWGEPSEPGGEWSDLVDQEFFKNFFTEDLYHLGVAHAMAWDEFIPLISTDTHYDWIAKSLTLFGDPELPMWLQPPDGPLQIDSPDTLGVGTSNILVTVTDNSGPVEDARVCIMQGPWDDPSLYAVDYTDGSGQVNMNVTATDDYDTAALTAWSRNHSPVTVDLTISGTGISTPDTPHLEPFLSAPTPNPATGSISFSWASPQGDASVMIIDIAGRMINRFQLQRSSAGSLVWNLDDMNGRRVPAGLYFALFRAPGINSVTRSVMVLGND